METINEEVLPGDGDQGAEPPQAEAPAVLTYVTYDDAGLLTGYFTQVLQPEHAGCHIEVFPPLEESWLAYRANAARDALELIPPAAPTIQQLTAQYHVAVQRELDRAAKRVGYESILSAVTYADEPAVPRFQEEGRRLRAWRSRVWAACYDMLDQVQRGDVPIPTEAAVLAALPQLDDAAE